MTRDGAVLQIIAYERLEDFAGYFQHATRTVLATFEHAACIPCRRARPARSSMYEASWTRQCCTSHTSGAEASLHSARTTIHPPLTSVEARLSSSFGRLGTSRWRKPGGSTRIPQRPEAHHGRTDTGAASGPLAEQVPARASRARESSCATWLAPWQGAQHGKCRAGPHPAALPHASPGDGHQTTQRTIRSSARGPRRAGTSRYLGRGTD